MHFKELLSDIQLTALTMSKDEDVSTADTASPVFGIYISEGI